jgi:hypothetical protein
LRARRHLNLAFVAQGNHEQTAFRMSRHDRRTMRAPMQQALAIEKRDVAVVQLIVMAGQTALFENRRHAFVEKTRIAIGPEYRERGQQQRGGKSAHYCFMPMPN